MAGYSLGFWKASDKICQAAYYRPAAAATTATDLCLFTKTD